MRSVPQVSGRNIRFLTLLQLSAHAGQAGLQAGRAVVEQHLDLSVADAEAVRVADGGGEQEMCIRDRVSMVAAGAMLNPSMRRNAKHAAHKAEHAMHRAADRVEDFIG